MQEEEIIRKLTEHDGRFDRHDDRFDRVEQALLEHDDRFDRIDQTLLEHNERFDRIENKMLEHDDRFDRIETTMATKSDIGMIMNVLDQQTVILKHLDHELTSTRSRCDRMDGDIRELKVHVGTV